MATGLSATAFEALKTKLWGFMQAEIYPNEQLFAAQSKAIGEASHDWHWPPILLELKRKAKAQGLWNLFLPVDSAAAAGVDQSVVGGGLTITNGGAGNQARMMRWGLIPFWAKDTKIGYKMINARGETVADNRAFKYAFQKHRCLIPADSFYEWQGSGKNRQPIRIMLKSEETFAFVPAKACTKLLPRCAAQSRIERYQWQ